MTASEAMERRLINAIYESGVDNDSERWPVIEKAITALVAAVREEEKQRYLKFIEADTSKPIIADRESGVVVAEGCWDARLGKVDVGQHWIGRSTALDGRFVRVEVFPVIPDPKDAAIRGGR